MKEDIFWETGAMKKGHFLLASGAHSEFYFQAQSMLQYPERARQAAGELAKLWNRKKIEVVVSLAVGGIVLGQEVARELGVRHIFLERKREKFSMERSFVLNKDEKVLLVEDVITTGGSLREAIVVLRKYKVKITGIAALVLRGKVRFQYPVKTLLKLNWLKYTPSFCPLCKAGIPLYIPGTKQGRKRKQI